MRLLRILDDGELSLVEYVGNSVPPYAILSHTWGSDSDEVTFRDVTEGVGRSKAGYRKLTFCSKQSACDGLQYFWIDTCCIDKTSSAELAEAINSMFRWYQNAEKCYVYLSDVSVNINGIGGELRGSRWFTRGWTLQELIAPASVEFFSKEEERLGDKQSLEETLSEITGVAIRALRGTTLSQFSVEERMSWAVRRETKREEDAAYCLLGIFGIHMPLIYGEGRKKALNRLQREIRQSLKDTLPRSDPEFAALSCSTDQYLPFKSSERMMPEDHGHASRASGLESKAGFSTLSEEQRKELIASLHFKQRDARLLTLKSAQTRTCRWLLKNTHYKDWMNADKLKQHHGFFWIKGKPGTGKSIMMKFLFSEAKKVMKRSLVLSFFFNARGGSLEKSTSGLYRALLLQLLEKAPEIWDTLDFYGASGFEIIKDAGWRHETLQDLFKQALQTLRDHRVVCYVDALDECPEDDVREMVSFFEELGRLERAAEFRVCFSSRHYPEISIQTGLQLVLESEQDHTNDITLYINTHLNVGKDTQAEDIKAEILHKSSGIFLWVSLVIPMLNKEYDRGRIKALKKRLGEIPAGLHDLFLDMLTRDHKNMEELLVCVQVILFAARPLKPEEFRVAVETCCDDDLPPGQCDAIHLMPENLRKFVLDASKGLAEITKSKESTVQFIHESVRDFLLKEGGLRRLLPDAENYEGKGHNTLKSICLLHISSFNDSNDGNNGGETLGSSRLTHAFYLLQTELAKKYPLLQYSAQYIFYHANWAQKLGVGQVVFLENFDMQAWREACCYTGRVEYLGISHLLHALAETGSANLIRVHPEKDRHFDLPGHRYGPPLLAALFAGHGAAARAFVDLPPLPEQESTEATQGKLRRSHALKKETLKKSRNLLSFLCEYGDTDILRKVLESRHFDMDFTMATQCFDFASSEAVVDMLAEFGACSIISNNSMDDVTELPSLCNAKMPTCATIRHLEQSLKKHPDLIDRFKTWDVFESPLVYAAARGFEQIARLCVEDTNITDRQTAFLSAVRGRINQSGRISIMRCLLEVGVQPENALNNDFAWLLFDIINQPYNEDVVRLLLSSASLNLETKNSEGLTILLWAIQQGRKAYVQMFLSAGSDPMARTRDGAPALILAVKLGDLSSFRSILECAKCEPDARDKNGRTALSWCATVADECAITMISDLLKSPHVDPNSKEKSGQTVLMRAVQSGNLKLVGTLLSSTIIDPDLGSRGRSTPLRLAFKLYREDRHQVFWAISRLLLLTFKVNPDCRDKLPTPAELASEYGFKDLLTLLEVFQRGRTMMEQISYPYSRCSEELANLRWTGGP
ncbi:hypothetical protein FB567DRAFT_526687 [Paraphoma chrysanthemicola]|uniref:Heterokaryon incompatibility domain-containing protein n=1 Tax=Paraphoma chrysanthemicola TaxID=798071 RepID=A0A8K0VYM1_9PLEO|nr:hypothetical protein FB567DRAFT_526687 [Paraphoma chrysanthemicola]